MSGRSKAGVTAFVLLIATWLVATLVPDELRRLLARPHGQPARQGQDRRPDPGHRREGLPRQGRAPAADGGAVRSRRPRLPGRGDVRLAQPEAGRLPQERHLPAAGELRQGRGRVRRRHGQLPGLGDRLRAPRARLHVRYVGADPRRHPRRTRRRRARGARQDPRRRRQPHREPEGGRLQHPQGLARQPGHAPHRAPQQAGDGQGQDRRLRGRPEAAPRSRSPSAAATSSRSRSTSRSAP